VVKVRAGEVERDDPDQQGYPTRRSGSECAQIREAEIGRSTTSAEGKAE
jgi:hypothetical protein